MRQLLSVLLLRQTKAGSDCARQGQKKELLKEEVLSSPQLLCPQCELHTAGGLGPGALLGGGRGRRSNPRSRPARPTRRPRGGA
jgi:hypothetical protein